MGEIIKLNSVKQNIVCNKEIVVFLKKQIKPLKAIKNKKISILNENIEILEENMNNIQEKAMKGIINYSEFEEFAHVAIDVAELPIANMGYYNLLFLYKIYSDYGENLFRITLSTLKQMFDVFLLFCEKENVNSLTGVFGFLDNMDLAWDFYSFFDNNEDIKRYFIKITSEKLANKDKSIDEIARDNIDYYRITEMTNYYDKDFEFGIITLKVLKKKMESQMKYIISFYKKQYNETNEEFFIEKIKEMEENLNVLIYELSKLDNKAQLIALEKIREIWTDLQIPLIKKIEMIFDMIGNMPKEKTKTLH
jgi:hypothetical protein